MTTVSLRVAGGTLLNLFPDVLSRMTDVGAFISRGDRQLFLETNNEGAIGMEEALSLVERGFGQFDGDGLFGQTDLSQAVFEWDCSAEIAGLESHFADRREERGIDLGCGYGRLMLPLAQRRYTLDGIDGNLNSIQRLASDIVPFTQCRVFVADICDYIARDLCFRLLGNEHSSLPEDPVGHSTAHEIGLS